jgi:hypothetical protein
MGLPNYPTGVSDDFRAKAWVRVVYRHNKVTDANGKQRKMNIKHCEIVYRGECVKVCATPNEANEVAEGYNKLLD